MTNGLKWVKLSPTLMRICMDKAPCRHEVSTKPEGLEWPIKALHEEQLIIKKHLKFGATFSTHCLLQGDGGFPNLLHSRSMEGFRKISSAQHSRNRANVAYD